jgi:[citrate (pro-3S)-lyase] ligase
LTDRRALAEADRLLGGEGLRRDAHLDYMAGLYDEDDRLIATGACFANTLRCLAVDGARRGEGLLSRLVSNLVELQVRRGHFPLFLYTRVDKAPLFSDLGFHEIARVQNRLAFMENRKNGFSSFLERLGPSLPLAEGQNGRRAALVMNCNPFTLGHRHLIERAAGENDETHLFVVSEDVSSFPFADRYDMVRQGCAGLSGVFLHTTESYMISNAVFPAYFLGDEESAVAAQASLDVVLFGKIAAALGVTRRYVGEEPFSEVTRAYNETLTRELPAMGVECVVVPRLERGGQPISASRVRELIRAGQWEAVRPLVPQSTFDHLREKCSLL